MVRTMHMRIMFLALAGFVAVLTIFMHIYIGSGSHRIIQELFSLDWGFYQNHPKGSFVQSLQRFNYDKPAQNKPAVVLPILEGHVSSKHSHQHNQEIRFVLRESNLGAPAFVGRNILDMGGGADVFGKQGRGDSVLDHFGNLSIPAWIPVSAADNSVAIGLAITTRKQGRLTADNLQTDLPFFKGLLHSFCYTATTGYDYHFYVGHDHDDPFFASKMAHQVFEMAFYNVVAKMCPNLFNVSLHMVECNHTGHPAWAQNDAMMTAYMDNMEYYYRVNDDTVFESSGWTEKFIEELSRYSPPRVGVVGPWFKEGNYQILTHDFVHRTHIDIFGYYYPRVFTDWFADNWITGVYSPQRCRKAPGTRVKHTMEQGSRYVVHFDKAEKVDVEVEIGKGIIERWIKSQAKGKETASKFPMSGLVVSLSLHGDNVDKLYGALRYTQLVSVMYPHWRIRFYVEKFSYSDSNVARILRIVVRKLEVSGAEIIHLDKNITSQLSPSLWRFLVADDVTVDRFIVRDTDIRPSERELAVLTEWLKTDAPWHCVRDEPRHAHQPLWPSLVGGIPKRLQELFPETWHTMLLGHKSDIDFLQSVVWPIIKNHALCHDSVSCRIWQGSTPFPVLRKDNTFVGQHHDANDEIVDATNTLQWNISYTSPDCVFLKNTGFHEKAVRAVLNHRPVMWSQDFHVTPIMDINSLLSPIGMKVIDKSLSYYCHSVGTCAEDLKVINRTNGMHLTQDIIEKFYATYKDDEEMKKVRIYVCTLPVAMCEAFTKFNKSMLIIATIRYEQNKWRAQEWSAFNAELLRIFHQGNNVIAANNQYDANYIEYFTGIKPVLLPNYCAYLPSKYNPTRREFLVAPIHSTELSDRFFSDFDNAVLQQNAGELTLFPLREMYPQYLFSDIAAHPAIIYIPYQVSMVSLTEQYRMNIPLFFPSLDLLTKWHLQYQVVRQRTWAGAHMKKSNSSVISGLHSDRPDPNDDYDEEAVRYWLQFADYYRWPHIIYYDSIGDLVHKMVSVNRTEVSIKMNEHNKKAQDYIKRTWSRVLLKLLDEVSL